MFNCLKCVTSPAGGCGHGQCIGWGIAVPGTTSFCMFDKSLFLDCLRYAMEIIILPKPPGRKKMSLVFGSPALRDYAGKKPVACLMEPKELESSCIM